MTPDPMVSLERCPERRDLCRRLRRPSSYSHLQRRSIESRADCGPGECGVLRSGNDRHLFFPLIEVKLLL
jgi:hypothetical protein